MIREPAHMADARKAERPGPGRPPIPFRRPPQTGRRGLLLVGVLGFGGLLAIAAIGIVTREQHEASLVRQTDRAAIPSVEVVSPVRGVQPDPLVLPGEIRAFY